jgi:hypothetical protein
LLEHSQTSRLFYVCALEARELLCLDHDSHAKKLA